MNIPYGSYGTWKWEGGTSLEEYMSLSFVRHPFLAWIWRTSTWRSCFRHLLLSHCWWVFWHSGCFSPPLKDVSQTMCKQLDKLLSQTQLIGKISKKQTHINTGFIHSNWASMWANYHNSLTSLGGELVANYNLPRNLLENASKEINTVQFYTFYSLHLAI